VPEKSCALRRDALRSRIQITGTRFLNDFIFAKILV
jgi:hypothetical protein